MRIFVSYSRRDAGDFANQISSHLSTSNHDIFTDVDSIKAGEIWSNNDNPFNWWNWWKTPATATDPSELWKKWATDWKKWVPDPAKIYVSSPLELPVKVNPILRKPAPSCC